MFLTYYDPVLLLPEQKTENLPGCLIRNPAVVAEYFRKVEQGDSFFQLVRKRSKN